ncbi:hypothetical protein DYU11_13655 [Fibrisoma montanum]|uniref:Uncharacterized protein n=1 Tax=Fibrisoma montanum TaxID=2305895 RepID=A0A418MC97_9BACT|nr:hypothetical protein [Fibrisoma montanum]RIV24004.1 hypothetical protein DYU11_13655 [Fibrisoma montanum]
MRRFLTIILLLLPTLLLAGGPWIRGYRKGFVQFGYSGLYYNAVFGPSGSELPVYRNLSDVTLQVYAEYGIARNWELRAVLPYKLLRSERSTNLSANPTPAGTLTGIGNIGLGLKRALLNGPVKLSVGVDALANTFANNDRLGLRTGYEGWTVMPYLSVGSGGSRTYYYAEAGYGFMTQNYSNFLKLNGELGYRLHPRLWVAGTLDFRLPARNGPFFNTEAYQFTGTYLNDQLFLGAGLKAAYDLVPDRLGLTASVIGALAGENVPFSRSYNAGIFIKW